MQDVFYVAIWTSFWLFLSLSPLNRKSANIVHLDWTQGFRMVGADGSTELWRLPWQWKDFEVIKQNFNKSKRKWSMEYHSLMRAPFFKWRNHGSFLFIFVLFNNITENCRLSRDWWSRRRARWPLDHHHGPIQDSMHLNFITLFF